MKRFIKRYSLQITRAICFAAVSTLIYCNVSQEQAYIFLKFICILVALDAGVRTGRAMFNYWENK